MSQNVAELGLSVNERFTALRKLCANGTITVDHYHKCLIVLALETAAAGDLQGTKDLIGECPEPYIVSVLPQQMRESAEFCEKVLFVTEFLRTHGTEDEVQGDKILESFAQIGKA